jgi:hypothetical protein
MNNLCIAMQVVLIGVGATAVMDLWLMALKIFSVPMLNFALLGRWVGNVFRGKWFHAAIATAQPIKGELLIGWLAHFVIGVFFAALLVSVIGVGWVQHPTFVPALLIGIATVVAPLLIMQPAFGVGIAFLKTATPLRSCIKSLINHAVFGCGLYVAGSVLTFLH